MLPGFLFSHASSRAARSLAFAVEKRVGPGHLGSLAEPAIIVDAFANPLQLHIP